MTASFIIQLGENVLLGHSVTYDEALALARISQHDIMLAAAYANKIRHHFTGNQIDMCGVIMMSVLFRSIYSIRLAALLLKKSFPPARLRYY